MYSIQKALISELWSKHKVEVKSVRFESSNSEKRILKFNKNVEIVKRWCVIEKVSKKIIGIISKK